MKRLLVIGILVFCACAKHDDLPPAIDVIDPPVPTDLAIQTEDFMTFQLSWTVDDPGVVAYYRIYSRFDFSEPALEDTTTVTSVQVTSAIPIPGVSFCVSTVTLENVESVLVCERAQ